jgi:hypothetical protein
MMVNKTKRESEEFYLVLMNYYSIDYYYSVCGYYYYCN